MRPTGASRVLRLGKRHAQHQRIPGGFPQEITAMELQSRREAMAC